MSSTLQAKNAVGEQRTVGTQTPHEDGTAEKQDGEMEGIGRLGRQSWILN